MLGTGFGWHTVPGVSQNVTLVWETCLGSTGILCVAKHWQWCWFWVWPAKLLTVLLMVSLAPLKIKLPPPTQGAHHPRTVGIGPCWETGTEYGR